MEIITKGEYAYRRLHDDILSGKIPGGSRLVVNHLVIALVLLLQRNRKFFWDETVIF